MEAETTPALAPSRPVDGYEGAGCSVLLSRLSRMSRWRLRKAFAALSMRTHEFAVLHYLAEAGPLSQRELGQALRVDPSNLVALLDELEGSGSVLRRRDPADRRRQLVALTEAGMARLRQAEHAALDTEREMLDPLAPAERTQLHSLLERMAAHACSEKGSCC